VLSELLIADPIRRCCDLLRYRCARSVDVLHRRRDPFSREMGGKYEDNETMDAAKRETYID